jgi:glycosyltransferase involved in cell wall biosynthesis
MLGIVIPAHNEQAVIVQCLAVVKKAAQHPGLCGEAVEILVVLDHCTDLTAAHVAQAQVAGLEIEARNVGVARALGAEAMLARGARWLAFTDADTQVAPDWLAEQLALQADAVICFVGILGRRTRTQTVTATSMAPTSASVQWPIAPRAASSIWPAARMSRWSRPCRPLALASPGARDRV